MGEHEVLDVRRLQRRGILVGDLERRQPTRIDPVYRPVAAVAVEVAGVALEADRVGAQPAAGGGIIPPGGVVLQLGRRVVEAAGVEEERGGRDVVGLGRGAVVLAAIMGWRPSWVGACEHAPYFTSRHKSEVDPVV